MLGPQVAWMADGYNVPHKASKVVAPSADLRARIVQAVSTGQVGDMSHGIHGERRTRSACSMQTGHQKRYSYRPQSARPASHSSRASSPLPKRRVKSAATTRHHADLTKSYSLITRLYQESRFRNSVWAGPDYKYPDRHARCYDQTHFHMELLHERPRTACNNREVKCYQAFRPSSAPARARGSSSKEYVTYLRPDTAIIWRGGGIQVLPRHNYIVRGEVPHFCNFVKKLHLHERDLSPPRADHSHVQQVLRVNAPDTISVTSAVGGSHDQSGLDGRPASPASDSGKRGELQEDEEHIEEEVASSIDQEADILLDGDDYHSSMQYVQEEHHQGSVDLSDHADSRSSPETNGPKIKIPTENSEAAGGEKLPGMPSKAWQEQEQKAAGDSKLKVPTPPTSKPASPQPPASAAKKSASQLKVNSASADSGRAQRQRPCIRKKEKKPVNNNRKQKQQPLPDTMAQETSSQTLPPSGDQSESEPPPLPEVPSEPQLPRVPDLPEVIPEKKETQKKTSRGFQPDRTMFQPFDGAMKPEFTEVLDQEMKSKRKEFEYPAALPPEPDHSATIMQRSKAQSFLQGRLALSQQASRFELPMDMKTLENMSPIEYLTRFCIISARRQTLYQKVFMKHKDGKLGLLTLRDLEKALRDVLVNTITQEEVKQICQLVGLQEDCTVNLKLFSGLAAMAERILYPKFLTEDTIDMPDYKKDKIESADFCALDWKFNGVNVNPAMKKILEAL